MKRKPNGFVARCQCNVIIGAMDFERTERREAGKILGEWLFNGCTVEPRFDFKWSASIEPCQCAATQEGSAKTEGDRE